MQSSLPDLGARVVRVGKGLARPASRDRYLEALRSPLQRIRLREPLADASQNCLVCGRGNPTKRDVTYAKDPKKQCTIFVCKACGYVANPYNVHDYTKYESIDKMKQMARVGTDEEPGREFHIGKMAAQMLKRRNASVLIYGVGRSMDYTHLAASGLYSRVAITDVVRLHDTEAFVDLPHSKERFDVVIASEVIEHLLNPRPEFRDLAKLVTKNGLLICSTNIYDGSDLTKHNYLFLKGHTSYYTPRAIEQLARSNGLYFDFRLPKIATDYAGPRKRYVFLTRSMNTLLAVNRYFGNHPFAPGK